MSSPSQPVSRLAPAAADIGVKMRTIRPQAGVEIIQPVDYVDRRSEARTHCDSLGALLFLNSGNVMQCRILDQSPSGARVAFDSIGSIPAEIWLIDLDTHLVRRGASAWSTPNRMGLKFNFIQTLVPGQARPAKIPQSVFDTWLRLTGNKVETPKPSDDDVLFFD